jgi:SAM-dependent MidA family methyltransferase
MERANAAFYAHHAPREHFRTSLVHADLMARGLLPYVDAVAASTSGNELALIDIGAGDGSLSAALLRALDERPVPRSPRVRVIAVDRRPRPPVLDARITWIRGDAPACVPLVESGVVIAHEWLDDLGVDPVQRDDDGTFTASAVDDDGHTETTTLSDDDAMVGWVQRWWPDARSVECGTRRDDAWRTLVGVLRHGVAVAIDYGHVRGERPNAPTLAAYRDGRAHPLALDGSVNMTAHVALDACAAAASSTEEVTGTWLIRQSQALGASAAAECEAGSLDSGVSLALHELAARSRWSELVDPNGLGAHWWLVQSVRMDAQALAQLPAEPVVGEPHGSIGV